MIIDFVENNDIAGVKNQLAKGVSQWVDKFGYSALHIALSKGFDDILIVLLDGGIDTNLQDSKGQTALHYCAFLNKVEIAKNILAHGGRLDIEDKFGNQPLWTAIINDKGFGSRIELVEIFISAGANPSHRNNTGGSPLKIAEDLEYDDVFALMN